MKRIYYCIHFDRIKHLGLYSNHILFSELLIAKKHKFYDIRKKKSFSCVSKTPTEFPQVKLHYRLVVPGNERLSTYRISLHTDSTKNYFLTIKHHDTFQESSPLCNQNSLQHLGDIHRRHSTLVQDDTYFYLS